MPSKFRKGGKNSKEKYPKVEKLTAVLFPPPEAKRDSTKKKELPVTARGSKNGRIESYRIISNAAAP